MHCSIPSLSSGIGMGSASVKAMGLGLPRPPAVFRRLQTRPSFHGTSQLALRPAWASWMPGAAPCASKNLAMRARGSMCSSFQIPTSRGEMRPFALAAVASTTTRPTPPTARLRGGQGENHWRSRRAPNTCTLATSPIGCGKSDPELSWGKQIHFGNDRDRKWPCQRESLSHERHFSLMASLQLSVILSP